MGAGEGAAATGQGEPERSRPGVGRRRGTVATDAALMQSILDAAPDAVYVKDLDHRYLLVNAACARLIGRPMDEIIGRTAPEVFDPEAARRIEAIEREVLASRTPCTLEQHFPRLDPPRSFVLTVSLHLEAGVPVAWIGIVRDVTGSRATEEALARSLSLHRAALDSTADGILVVDSSGHMVSFNRKFVEMWHIPQSILESRDDQRAIAFVLDQVVDPGAFLAKVHELYGQPDAESFDVLQFRDGRTIERYSKPQRLGGRSVGRVWSFRDVTLQQRAEQALRESERRYRDLFENANDLVYTHDLEGRFLEVNRRAREVSGYTLEETRALNIKEVLAPEQLPEVAVNLARGIAGEPMPVVELELVTKDGRRVPIEVNARILREGATPVAVQGIARDVSERRLAEAARAAQASLEASLARVGRELIASLASAALLPRLCQLVVEVLGTEGSTSFVRAPEDGAFCAVANVGRSAEDQEIIRALRFPANVIHALFPGLDSADVVYGSAQDVAPPVRGQLEKMGVAFWLGMALRRGDELVAIQFSGRGPAARPFGPQDERLALGIAQLASMALENARLFEENERASRLKSEFVATMSHELRTPLNIIIGYQDLLAEGAFGNPTEDQAGILARLQLKSRELLELVEATLDLSRIEAGRVRVELAQVALPKLLAEIDAETRELRAGRRLTFSAEVAEDASHFVSDPTKLKVILKNLVSNALKFTPEGTVRVTAVRVPEGVEISVRDTGVGIDPGALDIVFEPFRQADSSTTSFYAGVGLGLHIVRRLLDMLRGDVTVESRVGVGSCFRVLLPTASHRAAAHGKAIFDPRRRW
jgi:PAS domain S-box-containing protein